MKKRNIFRGGFSVVELLVVLVALASLLVVVLPLRADLEVTAGLTGCRANLRQMGLIFHTYVRDRNDGEFPLWRPRNIGGLNNQYPFHLIVRMLGTNGYTQEPRTWVCPSDLVDGDDAGTAVTAATNIASIRGVGNISYLFFAGHRLNSPENPSVAPHVTDEANQIENTSFWGSPFPRLTDDDNHGAALRNVLYLDGHVNAVTGTNVNEQFIYYSFVDPAHVMAVD